MLVDSEVNLNNSGVIIPDGMLAKVAGQNRFKVGNGVSTWSKLEYISSIALGNGLAFDENGQIVVDFSVMPTEKFEQLLKSIWVPIKLTANKNFYVNGTSGSDALSAGRGESADKAFKTIQACVNYVTQNYNVNVFSVFININSGVYTQQISLPNFNRTSGRIWLVSDGATLQWTPTAAYPAFAGCSLNGGSYVFENLTFRYIITNTQCSYSAGTWYVTCISANNYVSLDIHGCSIEVVNQSTVAVTSEALIQLLAASTYSNVVLYGTKGYPNLTFTTPAISINKIVFRIWSIGTNALLQIDCEENVASSILINGFGSHTFLVLSNGAFSRIHDWIKIKCSNENYQGYRYTIMNGGHASTYNGGPNFFPGNKAGTIETSSYSWYV